MQFWRIFGHFGLANPPGKSWTIGNFSVSSSVNTPRNFIIPFVEKLKEEISKPEAVARIKYETNDAFRLDESKRPKDAGPIESFGKLNVD